MIPLCIPDVGDEEVAAVAEVLRSGWLVHGPVGAAFEKEFAAYVGARKAVAVNSGTAALQLALLTLVTRGLTNGHVDTTPRGEVILPSFTFVASANAIVNSGYTPVFVEVEEETCTLDVERVEEAITERTVALMPVHFGGQSADMARLGALAEKH